MTRPKKGQMCYGLENDQVEEIITMILDRSADHNVPINHAIRHLNPSIKKKFGKPVCKAWFSRNVRKNAAWMTRWQDVVRHKSMALAEDTDELELEIVGRMFKVRQVTDLDGNVLAEESLLKREDIAAFRAIDHSRRRRIALLQPQLYAQKTEGDSKEAAAPAAIHIHLNETED